jgi:ubiquinone/menaquinone biosynthesis C-methylase UbiE
VTPDASNPGQSAHSDRTDTPGDASPAASSPTPGSRDESALDAIRETYADQADTLARMDWANRLLTGRYRGRLFGDASGRVLDVACGVGTNRRYVPASCEYVGVDLSPDVLDAARSRSGALEPGDDLFEMDAQDLAFDDDAFDTVISSLSTCTFPDPVAALDEMARVCAPDGDVRLLEHGRSSVELLGRFQDWRADAHFEKHRCRWTQDPLANVDASALDVREHSTAMLGIITAIEATPA